MENAMRKAVLVSLTLGLLAGCGGGFGLGRVGPAATSEDRVNNGPKSHSPEAQIHEEGSSTIWDAFRNKNTEAKVQVNRYLWQASLDVLGFLPVQSVDPFSGVIVFGYGTPPGGGRSYRATVLIDDPALDARSLNVALASRGGPVAGGTQRAVEDAILNRARQLRMSDSRF